MSCSLPPSHCERWRYRMALSPAGKWYRRRTGERSVRPSARTSTEASGGACINSNADHIPKNRVALRASRCDCCIEFKFSQVDRPSPEMRSTSAERQFRASALAMNVGGCASTTLIVGSVLLVG